MQKKLLKMIKTNIVLGKYTRQKNSDEDANFKAIRNIKELLEQIDLNAEVVPENNMDMFTRLIASLKNEELTKDEKRIIKDIVKLEER